MEYRFLTKWSEPALLVRHTSKQFPRLDFLLGAVSAASEEAHCWYVRDGRGKNWTMPTRAQITIRRHIYQAAGADIDDDDLDEDVELELDVEGDHALMTDLLVWWTPARKRASRASRWRTGDRSHQRR